MRTLYTVSFPEIAAADSAFIEDLRRRYDLPNSDIVAAHFTLVFGVQDATDDEYIGHVRAAAASSAAIPFTCRYAMLGADAVGDAAHVFLVPDEGYSAISLLHDRLHAGPLERLLRLDIPYVPRITIATLRDRKQAKQLCDQLNRAGLSITGTLRFLTVGSMHERKFANRFAVQLGAA